MALWVMRLRFAASILGALICLASSASVKRTTCPSGWLAFEDSCYLFDGTHAADWITASNQCMVQGAGLVEIESETENNMLVEQAKERDSTGLSAASYWIGSTDHLNEGEWTWHNSRKPLIQGYTNWAPAEPDDTGNQDCAMLYGPFEFQWSSNKCDMKTNAICEKNLTATNILGIIG